MNGAAAVVARQNRCLRAFHAAGATSPDSARTLADLHLRNSWVFRRMVARGVISRTADGRFYLDQAAADRFLRSRRTRVLLFVALAVVVAIIAWIVL